jgi:hypothetical protein
MPGHLDDAAGAFNAAAESVPVDLLHGADQQLSSVVQHLQQAGGPLGERLTGEVMSVQGEVQGLLARLADLQAQLQATVQQVLRGGG